MRIRPPSSTTSWLILSLLFAVSCSADAASDPTPDVAQMDATPADMSPDIEDLDLADGPSGTMSIAIALGPREVPFRAWTSGAEVVMIQGPQGGVHTEHRVRVEGIDDVDDLHLAIVYGEVWRDDLVLARAGWEFWGEDWENLRDGYEVELPVLIFDGRPDFGPAELRAQLELTDGRVADYSLPIELVDIP